MNEDEREKYDHMTKDINELKSVEASLKDRESIEQRQQYDIATQNTIKQFHNVMQKYGQVGGTSNHLKRHLDVEPEAPPKRRKSGHTDSGGSLESIRAEFIAFGQQVQSMWSVDSIVRTHIVNIGHRIDFIQHQINALCAAVRSETIVRRMKETAMAEFQKAKGSILC